MSPSAKIECKSEVSPALILIPDISGFSEYMNVADLSHGQARIASLLESIIDNNVLGLNISEIEGDAILFYKDNDTSTPGLIIEQCRLMFTRFHNKLMEFKEMNCQCGSCYILQNLSLKFILHYGVLGSVMIKDYCKLFGKDIIIAHRLLKNNLASKEYILFTQNFTSHYNLDAIENQINWSELKNESQVIPDIGRLEFHYTDLKPMKHFIKS